MAYVFYAAINKAAADKKISTPGDFAAASPVCDKFGGTGIDAGGLTQRGVGDHDGIYIHNSQGMGVSTTSLAVYIR